MTANRMKSTNLRQWNLVQMSLMQELGIALKPANVFAFGKLFADEVNRLNRLPRAAEVQQKVGGLV
jgi:hypothetical protein